MKHIYVPTAFALVTYMSYSVPGVRIC